MYTSTFVVDLNNVTKCLETRKLTNE